MGYNLGVNRNVHVYLENGMISQIGYIQWVSEAMI